MFWQEAEAPSQGGVACHEVFQGHAECAAQAAAKRGDTEETD